MKSRTQTESTLGKCLIVVAHPDDEAIGCGLLLQRLHAPVIAFMTDGAPQESYFWDKYGSREQYAALRRQEAEAALAEVTEKQVEYLNVPDQELVFHLEAALAWLREMVARHRPQTLVTHAYEGGHPDHDCCSFLCRMAAEEMRIPVYEMPLYSRVNGELARQHPPEKAGDAIAILATEEEERRKRKMVAAYGSQSEFLKTFAISAERFYAQPAHDFLRRPHAGKLNYECWGWEITGDDLCAAFQNAAATARLRQVKSA